MLVLCCRFASLRLINLLNPTMDMGGKLPEGSICLVFCLTTQLTTTTDVYMLLSLSRDTQAVRDNIYYPMSKSETPIF